MPDYRLFFPYASLHFDFDKSVWGRADIIDKEGESAVLIIEGEYSFKTDPLPHTIKVTSARLIKHRRGFDLNPSVVRIRRENS